jgi:hypothetical protein
MGELIIGSLRRGAFVHRRDARGYPVKFVLAGLSAGIAGPSLRLRTEWAHIVGSETSSTRKLEGW